MRFSSIVGGVLAALPVFTAGLTLSETTGQALSAFGKRSTVSEILTDIEDAATCVACNVCFNAETFKRDELMEDRLYWLS